MGNSETENAVAEKGNRICQNITGVQEKLSKELKKQPPNDFNIKKYETQLKLQQSSLGRKIKTL